MLTVQGGTVPILVWNLSTCNSVAKIKIKKKKLKLRHLAFKWLIQSHTVYLWQRQLGTTNLVYSSGAKVKHWVSSLKNETDGHFFTKRRMLQCKDEVWRKLLMPFIKFDRIWTKWGYIAKFKKMRVAVLLFDTRFLGNTECRNDWWHDSKFSVSRRMRFSLYSQEGPHLY